MTVHALMSGGAAEVLGGGGDNISPENAVPVGFNQAVYDGTGANRSVNFGMNLAANGGMVWIKSRSTSQNHILLDSERGWNNSTRVSTSSSATLSGTQTIAATSTGLDFSGTTEAALNASGTQYAAWAFQNCSGFFRTVIVSHTSSNATEVNLGELGTLGMVAIRPITGTDSWQVWHRDLDEGFFLSFTSQNAQSSSSIFTVNGTTLTLDTALPTGNYLIYAWAHDASNAGSIKCGSYIGNGTTSGPEVNLGWEPFFLVVKCATTGSTDWRLFDATRGVGARGVNQILAPNSTLVENEIAQIRTLHNGFQPIVNTSNVNGNGQKYVYLAVKFPMPIASTGSQCFSAVTYNGAASASRAFVNTLLYTDTVWVRHRTGTNLGFTIGDRNRSSQYILADSASTVDATGFQGASANTPSAAFASGNGFWTGASATPRVNGVTGTNNFVALAFRRRKLFYDRVAYLGKGTATGLITHNLGQVPSLVFVKRLDATGEWLTAARVDSGPFTTIRSATATGLSLTSSNYSVQLDQNLNLTSTTFDPLSLCGADVLRTNGGVYNAYLFGNVPGISKIGVYTGNGSSQTIDCGFTTGARFVLICPLVAGSNWRLFDSARGIVAATDPVLFTSSTDGDSIYNLDHIDPDSTGFIANHTVNVSINVSGTNYLFLAIS